MEHFVVGPVRNLASLGHAKSTGILALRLLPIALLVSACGGGGGGDGGGNAPNQVTPILQIGMQRQYVGTTTRSVVYVTPTASAPNNTLVYAFTQNQTVIQPPSGVSATFDLHNTYTYSVTQDPGTGVVPVSQTVDNYENLAINGSTQTVSTIGQTSTTVSSDETSNALGTGPYTETTSTNATYPTVRSNLPYPLQTGASQTVPQSYSETVAFSDVNASKAAPSNGSNIGYTLTRNENDDGSFSYTSTYVNGDTFVRTQNSDGSGTETLTSPTGTTNTVLGVPTMVNGVNTIPVAVTVAGTTTRTTNYSATDWYPDSGMPNSPLVSSTRVVVGPASSLPSECNAAVLRPNIYEVDTTTTALNPWGPTYAVTTTRAFNSGDAVTLCQLSTEVQSDYDLHTGALLSTTTTSTTTLLNAINY